MRFPRRRTKHAVTQELTEARAEARASSEQAHADLADQRELRAEEEATIVGPLRRLREANHFAAVIEAAFRGEKPR